MKRKISLFFILMVLLTAIACGKPAPPLGADFSASPLEAKAGEPVQFTSRVTGGVTPYSYEWDFDSDGNVDSQEANPVYSYSKAGSFTVSLKVVDAKGHTATVTKQTYITIAPKFDPEALARELVEKLKKGEFEAVYQSFNQVMAQALPLEKLKEVWTQVTSQVGELKGITKTRVAEEGEYKVVYVTCEFTQTYLDLKVVFDGEGKVAGLFFLPPSG